MSRDDMTTTDGDLEFLVESLGAPPEAPLAMPKQVLERSPEPFQPFRLMRAYLIGRPSASQGR